MREDLGLIERQEAEEGIRLQAMREAAEAGIADIAAGRFRTFVAADALEKLLSALSDRALREDACRETGGQSLELR